MATDDERLAILIEGRVADFEKSMATVTKRVAKMEMSIQGEMAGVERSSRRAAAAMDTAFERATAGIRNNIRGLAAAGGDLRGLFAGLGAVAPGVGLAGGVGLGASVAAITSTTAAIADMSAEAKRAGLSFREFQEVKFAFAQERVSLDAMVDGFKELQLRVDEFVVTGKGSGAEAFQRLGYSADELATKIKSPVDLLLEMIGRAKALGDTAAAIRILDEAWAAPVASNSFSFSTRARTSFAPTSPERTNWARSCPMRWASARPS